MVFTRIAKLGGKWSPLGPTVDDKKLFVSPGHQYRDDPQCPSEGHYHLSLAFALPKHRYLANVP
jgi:hypothetical protein